MHKEIHVVSIQGPVPDSERPRSRRKRRWSQRTSGRFLIICLEGDEPIKSGGRGRGKVCPLCFASTKACVGPILHLAVRESRLGRDPRIVFKTGTWYPGKAMSLIRRNRSPRSSFRDHQGPGLPTPLRGASAWSRFSAARSEAFVLADGGWPLAGRRGRESFPTLTRGDPVSIVSPEFQGHSASTRRESCREEIPRTVACRPVTRSPA